MDKHSEISPVILLDEALSHYLFANDIAAQYPDRLVGQPISVAENNHASISILLFVISIEGHFNRLLYFLARTDPSFKSVFEKIAVKKLELILKKSDRLDDLIEQFEEVHAVRNAITHSHIYLTSRTAKREILQITEQILRKDTLWNRVVDKRNHFRTKHLEINTIPSEVCFPDAQKVLVVWNSIYHEVNRLHPSVGHLPITYPHTYASFHKKDKLFRKLDNYIGTDGSLDEWVKFQ